MPTIRDAVKTGSSQLRDALVSMANMDIVQKKSRLGTKHAGMPDEWVLFSWFLVRGP